MSLNNIQLITFFSKKTTLYFWLELTQDQVNEDLTCWEQKEVDAILLRNI